MNNERYLVHHGILGQKWGVRRYQNEDGSLTAAGKNRYLTTAKAVGKTLLEGNVKGDGSSYENKFRKHGFVKKDDASRPKTVLTNRGADETEEHYKEHNYIPTSNSSKKNSTKNYKKYAIAGAAVLGTGLAVYGGYKASQYIKTSAGKKSYELGKKAIDTYTSLLFDDVVDSSKGAISDSFVSERRRNLEGIDARTKKVSKSTVAAIKYLRNPDKYSVDWERWIK